MTVLGGKNRILTCAVSVLFFVFAVVCRVLPYFYFVGFSFIFRLILLPL